MTKEDIIRNLRYTEEKHKNDRVDTFGTNISIMCADILKVLDRCIEIPEGATLGNVIMAVLSDMPDVKINENFGRIWIVQNGEDIANFRWSLWNSPYRKEQE